MLRKFTKDIGRFKTGATHDYPFAVWRKMAADSKQKLDSFTEQVEFNPGLQNPLRGPIKPRTRLGSTH